MAPNGVATVTVEYDVSQIDFQGIYTADVLITTNAQPIAKASTGNSRVLAGSGRDHTLLELLAIVLRTNPRHYLPDYGHPSAGWLTHRCDQSSYCPCVCADAS